MKLSFRVFYLLLFFSSPFCRNTANASSYFTRENSDKIICIDLQLIDFENNNLMELSNLSPFKFFKQNTKSPRHRKLIAAILAFPFPFGIVGLHRIYLGTAPHVPVVYIGTLGGGFGLIPLIDFFAILFVKDIDQYMNNKQVFMWVK